MASGEGTIRFVPCSGRLSPAGQPSFTRRISHLCRVTDRQIVLTASFFAATMAILVTDTPRGIALDIDR